MTPPGQAAVEGHLLVVVGVFRGDLFVEVFGVGEVIEEALRLVGFAALINLLNALTSAALGGFVTRQFHGQLPPELTIAEWFLPNFYQARDLLPNCANFMARMRMREWLERARQGLDLPDAPESFPGGLAPIYTCAAAGRRDAIELLLQAGWDLNEHGQGFRAALDFPEMRPFLLERGARAVVDGFGQTPLFGSVLGGQTEWVVTQLELGADPNHRDQEGRTPLWLAVKRRRLKILKLLLEAGGDPNLADHEGVTPLMKATHPAVQARLLGAGARSHCRDGQGRSLFQHLCHRPEALRSLIEQLPESEVPAEFRLWYLYKTRDRFEFEGLCLEQIDNLPPDRPVVHGQSVLWWAARLGCRKCCQPLMERGWNPLRKDRLGRTAVDVAISPNTFRDFSASPHSLP